MIDLKIGDTIRIRKLKPFVPTDWSSWAGGPYTPDETEELVITNEEELKQARELCK